MVGNTSDAVWKVSMDLYQYHSHQNIATRVSTGGNANVQIQMGPRTIPSCNASCKSRFISSDSDVAPNRLHNHFQATDRFDAGDDADAWCNSTGQNPYI